MSLFWSNTVSAGLRIFISRTPTNTYKYMHSLMDTHRVSGEGAREAGLALGGCSLQFSSLVITDVETLVHLALLPLRR